jgi:site-specific DNA-methyltransferase (adenine-specific)
MGSGQTAIASLATGRHYLGYEIDQEYLKLAEERIRQYRDSNS